MSRKGVKHVSLTNKQKIELCNFSRDNPKVKQSDLVQWVMKTYDLKVDRSTISKILNNTSFNQKNTKVTQLDSKRTKKVQFPQLDDMLTEWFLRFENIAPITDAIIVEKAKQFANQLKITEDNITFSHGWLRCFKNRNKIKSIKTCGESGSVNNTIVEAAIPELTALLEQYNPNDIYNFDETALFYRMEPDRTLASKRISGRKEDKERLTVALCSNATGSDKLIPLVIGKYQNPRCFKNINLRNVGVKYTFNKKAWMTALIFQEWLTTFDKLIRIENPNRKVLLLIDNAGSHSIHGLELKNVVIKFLPPNTTSKLQPLDAGIIRSFKAKYRKRFIRFLIEDLEKHSFVKTKLNVLGAIRFVVESWNEVSDNTIKNCWNHTKLVNILDTASEDNGIEDSSIENDISDLQLPNPMCLSEYINYAEEEVIEDILDECYNEEEDYEEVDDTIEEPKITHSEAINSCNTLIHYYEQQSDNFSSQILNLHKFKNEIMKVQSCSLKQTSILDYFHKK
jgi:hypothetical protein